MTLFYDLFDIYVEFIRYMTSRVFCTLHIEARPAQIINRYQIPLPLCIQSSIGCCWVYGNPVTAQYFPDGILYSVMLIKYPPLSADMFRKIL